MPLNLFTPEPRSLCENLGYFNTILAPENGFDTVLWLEAANLETSELRRELIASRVTDPALAECWIAPDTGILQIMEELNADAPVASGLI